MSTIFSFKNRQNKHDVCRFEDRMKTYCEHLREHAMKKKLKASIKS